MHVIVPTRLAAVAEARDAAMNEVEAWLKHGRLCGFGKRRHAFLRPIGQLSSSTSATTIRTLCSEFLLPTRPIVRHFCE